MDWFASRLLRWFDLHGRKELPWQQDPTPYRVWVSEVMLQQTQVAAVIPYYQRFMARFPDVFALAAADIDEVLHHWTGLGYYARGRNLHAAAREVVERYGGHFPDQVEELARLPGIGRSTAGAIAAIAFGRRAPILDGNVKRVLARFHAVAGHPGASGVAAVLWRHVEDHTPVRRIAAFTQAIMDLGATVCTRSRPSCAHCPVAARCQARAMEAVQRFPAPKPRREKPVRSARMFLISDPAARCLLEQRPAKGLWGGLWTPPERPADTLVDRLCEELRIPAGDVAATSTGDAFRHTFTHFHLDIEPVYVRLDRICTAVADRDDVRWYHVDASKAQPPLGLSAPAARLLTTLANQAP